MADPHELPRFSGPRLPSEETQESEVDPEAFRKVLKVDESDESQKRNKRQKAEEEKEAKEDDKELAEQEATDAASTGRFSSMMSDDQDTDSVFDVGSAKGGVKRARGEAPENTQSFSGPKSSYSGQFLGKDKGEEVGDEVFENIAEAPPEYSETAPVEEPNELPEQKARPTEHQTETPPPQPTDEVSQKKTEPVKEGHKTEKSEHSSKEHHEKEHAHKADKKVEPLDLEAEKKVEKPEEVKQKGEEVHEITGEKIEEPKEAKVDPKAGLDAPVEKKVEDTGIHAPKSEASGEDHQDEHEEKPEAEPLHFDELHEEKPKEKDAAPGFEKIKKKKGEVNDADVANVYEQQPHHTQGIDQQNVEKKVGEKGDAKVQKNVVRQPQTPVIFNHEGKVETASNQDSDKGDQQQQGQNQTMEIQGGTPNVAGAEAPEYSKLNPDVYELFEKFVGLLTIEYAKGVSITTVKLSLPGSVFDRSKVVFERYETAPGTFNLQLQGSEQAVNMFSANISQLAAAFAGSKLAFDVNIRQPELLKEDRTVLNRKSQDYHEGEQNHEGK